MVSSGCDCDVKLHKTCFMIVALKTFLVTCDYLPRFKASSRRVRSSRSEELAAVVTVVQAWNTTLNSYRWVLGPWALVRVQQEAPQARTVASQQAALRRNHAECPRGCGLHTFLAGLLGHPCLLVDG